MCDMPLKMWHVCVGASHNLSPITCQIRRRLFQTEYALIRSDVLLRRISYLVTEECHKFGTQSGVHRLGVDNTDLSSV